MKKKDKRFAEEQIFALLSEKFELTQKQIRDLFQEYEEIAIAHIKELGCFSLLGIGKITKKDYKERLGYFKGKRGTFPQRSGLKMHFSEKFWEDVVGEKPREWINEIQHEEES